MAVRDPASGTVIDYLSLRETTTRALMALPMIPGERLFAGSRLIEDPFDKTKKPFYAANDGDVICVSNFDTAMLDLPVDSSRDNADLIFEAQTERIPAVDTPVRVILEPVLPKKEDKK